MKLAFAILFIVGFLIEVHNIYCCIKEKEVNASFTHNRERYLAYILSFILIALMFLSEASSNLTQWLS